MSKLVGAAIVLFATAGLGNDAAREVRRRLDALYQCKTLVTLLQSQIRYAGADMEEMLQETAGRLSGAFRELCLTLAEVVRGRNCRDMETIWRVGVEECLARSGLTATDRELLADAGKALGYLDGESQCRHLEHYLERLAPEIARAEAETGQKSRLYRSLGLFAGLFATILFI